jgi:hypothetical protein
MHILVMTEQDISARPFVGRLGFNFGVKAVAVDNL